MELSLSGLLKIYGFGLLYDITVALLLTSAYTLYLTILPRKWLKSIFNRIVTYFAITVLITIVFFSFFAELTFWQEFESRFNFIAVDYLIYTYEVVNNINESYPLPFLFGFIFLLVGLVLWFFSRRLIFYRTFNIDLPTGKRILTGSAILFVTSLLVVLMKNSQAETGPNRYQNELSKAGIYSFFAAFKDNELNYDNFYALLPKQEAYKIVRASLSQSPAIFNGSPNSIKREIQSAVKPYRPNVIMITLESFSADFMAHFGNTEKLTPVLDSIADQNLLFTNMYATGTRTVRGMEALSLAIPPTPGNSIVRRPENKNLTTVGNIFKQAGYSRTFYYGGDGYFDNMNEYFGGNGFDITDRGRNLKMNDTYLTKRTLITDGQVTFENAWGISDEDLFDAALRGADKNAATGKPFYNFIMTTSNHRPFTFPDGKISRPSGTREAAVQYTDYAIGQFLKKLKQRSWYSNTVVIIVADHCAGSAGKNEIEISKYHIPCIVVNLPQSKKQTIDKLCSQIDLYPTLFSLLGWTYQSNLFGLDVLQPSFEPRAFMGTYQKLGYLKKDSLVILSPQQKIDTYLYQSATGDQKPHKLSDGLVKEAMASYQTAFDLYKTGGLKQ